MIDIIQTVAKMLDNAGIRMAVVHLSGGGDEGTSEISHFVMDDESELFFSEVKEKTSIDFDRVIAISEYNTPTSLEDWLLLKAEQFPEIDWVNNAGGSGHVYFEVSESDGEMTLSISDDVSECEEEDEYDDEEDNEDGEEEEEGPAPTPLPRPGM